MARLHSEQTCRRIIDGGLDGDQPYLAMEYVPGMTLADLIAKEGRPSGWRGRARCIRGARLAAGASAVFAHRAFRFVAPGPPSRSNVMITPRMAW